MAQSGTMRAARFGRNRRSARARRKHLRQEGAAAVEFALILPLFAILLLGLIDFGHFFFTMNTMVNAAREGARRGSVIANPGDAKTAAEDTANSYLQNAGLHGPNCKLNCSNAVAVVTNAGKPDDNVKVTIKINGAFKNITGFSYKVLPGFNNPFASMKDLKSSSTMRWELAPAQ